LITFADRGRRAVDAAREAFDTIDKLLEKQITPDGLRGLRRSLVEVLEISLEPSVGAAVTAAAPPGPAQPHRL